MVKVQREGWKIMTFKYKGKKYRVKEYGLLMHLGTIVGAVCFGVTLTAMALVVAL